MNILVIDSNRVCARLICEALRRIPGVTKADFACNSPVVHDRILKESYDVVLADVESAPDSDLIIDELHMLQATGCSVILWGLMNDHVYAKDEFLKYIQKSFEPKKLKTTLMSLLT